jgi:hypothetical protein
MFEPHLVTLWKVEWLLHEREWNWLECLSLLAEVDMAAAEGLKLQDWSSLKGHLARNIGKFSHLPLQVGRLLKASSGLEK